MHLSNYLYFWPNVFNGLYLLNRSFYTYVNLLILKLRLGSLMSSPLFHFRSELKLKAMKKQKKVFYSAVSYSTVSE